MKRIIMMCSFVLVIYMAGCANKNTEGVNEDGQEVMNQADNEQLVETPAQQGQSDQEYFQSQMDKLTFNEFEVEVKYANDKEYEAEIDKKSNGMYKAEVEDELNNRYLQDREAFDDIYSKIQTLDITSNSTQDDVIEQVLKAFGLPNDYIKFEIEIHFDDGKKLEFEHRK